MGVCRDRGRYVTIGDNTLGVVTVKDGILVESRYGVYVVINGCILGMCCKRGDVYRDGQ